MQLQCHGGIVCCKKGVLPSLSLLNVKKLTVIQGATYRRLDNFAIDMVEDQCMAAKGE